MDSKYHAIYKEMIEEYESGQRIFPYLYPSAHDRSLHLIERAIQEVCDRRGVVLRPDAKFFLLTNFHQMVAMPVTLVHGRTGQDQIADLIQADIDQIVSVAADEPNDGNEISGGKILRSTAKVWDNLKTNAENIWS